MTVDYLPIANSGGANVESQAQYVIDLAGGGSLVTGYLAGLAKSNQMNKTFRQSSMVSAAVANYISQALSIDVLDDGNLATLITNLTNAIKATVAAGTRIPINAGLTIFCSPSGNDSNSGLVIGSPKKTMGSAYAMLQQNYDLRGQQVTIQLADGNYPDDLTAFLPLTGQGSSVVINGHSGSSASVTVDAITASLGAFLQPQNLKFTSAVLAKSSLTAAQGGEIFMGLGLIFGATTNVQISANFGGGIFGGLPYTIAGGAANHVAAGTSGFIDIDGATVTLTGTPAYSGSFASASAGNINAGGISFSGSATGVRYLASGNGVILTNGGGATYFPGGSAGSVATGGQYL